MCRLLDALGWKAGEVDYFACGIGPGSFTGLRIGLAAVKGLAFGAKRPVIGIPSLDILAQNTLPLKTDKTVIPVIDAKRNLLYCGFYKIQGGVLKKIKPYLLLPPEGLCRQIKSPAVFLGDALAVHQEAIAKRVKYAEFLDKDYWRLRAGNIINLALERIRRKEITDYFSVKAAYLYPKECQVKRE
jgi:tRNA threonylcarbamoyladenosine biosynthesis protein TsaB